MPDFTEVLRSGSGPSEMPEILSRPTRDLLGVSEEAAEVLAGLGIQTIFDLGASRLFDAARTVLELSDATASPGGLGMIPGDLLADGDAGSLDTLGDLPLSRLRGIDPERTQELSEALDVVTIADLANWPPHREARRILGDAAGGTVDLEESQAEGLRPRFGQYPTERVYYQTLVLFDILGDGEPLEELTGQVSLRSAVEQIGGMTRPGVGALVTFEQSWFAQGVTLGQLLHSLSLAPGEATRIAVIDWSRRTSAFAAETIGETEQLDSATTHARSLSEVQSAVAEDLQKGGSSSSSTATSTSESEASAGSSGLLTSLFSSGSASSTFQTATTSAQAESSSWSIGNRSVLASMSQNVNDRTEQHSSSVRNRRATAVREVAQSEHEQVSTRIVANYNHMHALNIQYYEVVQVYRTEARLHRADRCLFIPMEALDFRDDEGRAVVERFRGALVRAALNDRIRALLSDDTTAVEIAPTKRVFFPGTRPDLVRVEPAAALLTARERASARLTSLTRRAGEVSLDTSDSPAAPASDDGSTVAPPPEPSGSDPRIASLRFWDADQLARVSRLVARPLVRPDSESLFVPDDTELIAISFDDVVIRAVRFDHVGSTASDDLTFTVPPDSGHVDLSPGVRLAELEAIHVTKGNDPITRGEMTLHCAFLGRRFTLPSIPLDLSAGTAPQKVVTFSTDQADRRRELQQHLQDHQEYYSRAVFQSLDAATLTFVLGRFQLNGRPLIDQVEPRPVTIAGNYVVLRAPVSDEEESGLDVDGRPVSWAELLELRGLDRDQSLDRRLIPIPTGGVFAEAVLGRSNSAEKLDMTRFWHWEDSPIPLQPTEIAAVQTGSRGAAETLQPGQLSTPVLNITNPTALPDPTGIGAALNALAALNFRDMSGLAGTQGLVSSAAQGTLTAATDAGKLAAENLKTEAQKAVAMGQIAGDIAKAAIAAQAAKASKKEQGGSGGGGSMSGISRDGALMNQGQRLDAKGASPSQLQQLNSGNGTGGVGVGAGGTEAGGTGGNGTGGVSGSLGGGSGIDSGLGGGAVLAGDGAGLGSGGLSGGGGHEVSAFNNALFGPLGSSGLDAAKVLLASDTQSAKTTGGGVAPALSPFPGRFTDPLTVNSSTFNGPLDSAFLGALNAAAVDSRFSSLGSVRDIAIDIVSFEPDGTRIVTGQNDFLMMYSGSLLKAAAMYAAFQLHATVNEFAATHVIDAADAPDVARRKLFDALRAAFDRQIVGAVPRINARGLDPRILVPKYDQIFSATPDAGRFKLEFKGTGATPTDFALHLRRMIVGSHNESAAIVIRALGYSWINGVMQSAGLLRDPIGIWLAGDYENQPVVVIPTENDELAKQATTCIDFARMFVLLQDDKLVKDDAGSTLHTRMKELLKDAIVDPAAKSLLETALPSLNVLGSKIGVGNLKKGPGGGEGSCREAGKGCVLSEAAILRHSSGRLFVTVWQNVPWESDARLGVERIAFIVNKTMDDYRP